MEWRIEEDPLIAKYAMNGAPEAHLRANYLLLGREDFKLYRFPCKKTAMSVKHSGTPTGNLL